MDENRPWKAKWIWAESREAERESARGSVETVLFRRTFTAAADAGSSLRVAVSADSRYLLYMNGTIVSSGPCKGDQNTYYYETLDLTTHLQPGVNVLAAWVVHYPPSDPGGRWPRGPASVWRSDRGGFLCEGSLEEGPEGRTEVLDTGAGWKALRLLLEAFTLERETFTLFIGGGERVDGTLFPQGWERAEYPDAHWDAAVTAAEPFDPMYGELPRWMLSPRPIPLMEETEEGFARVVRGSGTEAEGVLTTPLTVQPGERIWLEVDAGRLTAGYPVLEMAGGKSSVISLLYSECYEFPPSSEGRRNKGVRDDPVGKALYGFEDRYRAGGSAHSELDPPERYRPFHRRAFRFIRLEAEAAAEPLTIRRFGFARSGYPLRAAAEFSCSDESMRPLWDISLNTLRNCMHETYEDTPYYEQMGYELDSRLQALFTYKVSGDDRLARKAMYDFHSSLLPSGMLQSRYPSVSRQVIPGFALFWIMMVYDHYEHYADAELVIDYLPTADAVLRWFDRMRDGTGLVGTMPAAYWSFVDWTEDWRDTAGAPPAARKGPLTVYNFMYADALEKAAEMNEWTGRKDTAEEYRARAGRIRTKALQSCWSEERGLFRDGPEEHSFSQHAQIWAVLSGTVRGEEAQSLMERTLAEEGLAQASYANRFYLFRALAKTGLYGKSLPLWDAWKSQVGLGLTAWVEDPVSERSDCHAWGALPLYEFPAEILGVRPGAPGHAAILIAPRGLFLRSAQGTVMTPHGAVFVAWELDGDAFRLSAKTPEHIPVTVELPDGTVHHPQDGGNPIIIECPIGARQGENPAWN